MIEVLAVGGITAVQDAGRPGRMHEGVPPGGALVPELLARANAAARNSPGEAALEVFGSLTIVGRGSSMVVASDDGVAHTVAEGVELTVACARARVRYVAVRGGVDVPRVLGGRGTLLLAAVGGFRGRALRKGDLVAVGTSTECHTPLPPAPDTVAPIRVVLGPDMDRFAPSAFDTLFGSTYEVSQRSDRVGCRLRGPPLERIGNDADVSGPMVRGAIQVPASGEAIVLGPDHPTMGGYPVIATVVLADMGRLLARSVGAQVRFAR